MNVVNIIIPPDWQIELFFIGNISRFIYYGSIPRSYTRLDFLLPWPGTQYRLTHEHD